jgi:hypothetical protein
MWSAAPKGAAFTVASALLDARRAQLGCVFVPTVNNRKVPSMFRLLF